MIKKFDLDRIYSTSVDGIHWEYRPNRDDILEKINEIIDAVNAIELKERNRSHLTYEQKKILKSWADKREVEE